MVIVNVWFLCRVTGPRTRPIGNLMISCRSIVLFTGFTRGSTKRESIWALALRILINAAITEIEHVELANVLQKSFRAMESLLCCKISAKPCSSNYDLPIKTPSRLIVLPLLHSHLLSYSGRGEAVKLTVFPLIARTSSGSTDLLTSRPFRYHSASTGVQLVRHLPLQLEHWNDVGSPLFCDISIKHKLDLPQR